MYKGKKIIAIIPARGGSKGIPKKNIRLLAGKPLISYSIENALQSKYIDEVVVSTDDEEIAHIAEQYGAKILKRPKNLANDHTTLGPVIQHVFETLKRKGKLFDIIITLQPTSPTLKSSSINKAIERLGDNDALDTIISVISDSHLSWSQKDTKFYPLYEERLNRQDLPEQFRETGGILACKGKILEKGTRIGQGIDLLVLDRHEGIDIDSEMDWWIVEKLIKRKRILMRVDGNREIGLGHIYRTITLANRIMDHEIIFLTNKNSCLGKRLIDQSNYKVLTFSTEQELFQIIDQLKPDILINDILDTSTHYMRMLAERNIFIVNFEDLGEGAELADLVFNALYEKHNLRPNHYWGKDFYCLREEFFAGSPKKIKKDAKNILISFGGIDLNNYTFRILNILNSLKISLNIDVVLGLGNTAFDNPQQDRKKFCNLNVRIYRNIKSISKYIKRNDIVFTSAGRTVYEIASIGTPTIVLAQNERELNHLFASSENGFINLGLGTLIDNKAIENAFLDLYHNQKLRERNSALMLKNDLQRGTDRVIRLIFTTFEEKRNVL